MVMRSSYKPVVLAVLDGFGISLEERGNPVMEAKKPFLDTFDHNFPFTTLQASGVAVGLPWGEAGNSEVGHLTLGTGRVIYHHLPRVINAIHEGVFFQNQAFLDAVAHVKKHGSSLHILGLTSSGSVHSYLDHLYALLTFADASEAPRTYLHVVSDGKDAPPKEGGKFFADLEARVKEMYPKTKIASLTGRFYAMDRDEKWDRIRKAYDLYTKGEGVKIEGTIAEYALNSYEKGLTDEFLEPAYVAGPDGAPIGRIKDNDALIIFNFREDSMRELSHALVDLGFDAFPRMRVDNLFLVTMTEYEKDLNAHAAFPPIDVISPLAKVISDAGFRQLHIAETEKYAHVTYFFNGGREKPFQNEERILIPSVPTAHFDEVPEMKSAEIAGRVIEELPRHDFVLVNFANTDMVGHSGNYRAAVTAVEAVDRAMGELYAAVMKLGGVLLVTGDHGNVERKRNLVTGEVLTEHSLNPVPLYLIGHDFQIPTPRTREEIAIQKKETRGVLTDVAPTVLELMGLKKPLEMNGNSLLQELTQEHDHT